MALSIVDGWELASWEARGLQILRDIQRIQRTRFVDLPFLGGSS
jgi:hypothetical protein